MGSDLSDKAPEVTFGDYVIIGRVAVGGMAELFEARRSLADDQSAVIIKVLLPQFAADEELKRNFEHEARIASTIEHRNLIDIMDSGVVDDRPFLVMEKIDGPSLAAMLDVLGSEERILPISLSITIIREVLLALEAVHDAKASDGSALSVVHRDVSPQNILLSRLGEVRLGDFGIALSSLRDTRTRTGVIKGKTQYLAPEQVTLSMVDHRTDVYAVGLVLWEMLTGKPYLQGESDLDLLKSAENPTFRPPSSLAKGLDPRYDKLADRALARFPEQRFQTTSAFLDAIEELREPSSLSVDGDDLISIVEEVMSTQGATKSSAHELPRFRSSPALEGDPRGTKVSTPAAKPRRISIRTLVVAILLVLVGAASLVLLLERGTSIEDMASSDSTDLSTLSRSESGRQDSGAEDEADMMAATQQSLDASHTQNTKTEGGPVAPRDEPAKGRAIPPSEGQQASPSEGQQASPSEGQQAPPIPEADPRLEELSQRLAGLRNEMRTRGILVVDLAPSHLQLLRQVGNDLDAERFDTAARGLESAEQMLSALQLDREFIQRKLDRVDGRIRHAHDRGVDTERIEALERVALREFMSGRLETTNRHLNQILRALDELERSPSP